MSKLTRSLLFRWLPLAWASACASGDMGTPTPEPPDHLPRPELPFPASTAEVDTRFGEVLPPFEVSAGPGTVQGDTEVWIVNLDRPDAAPVRVRASAQGAFTATIEDASPGNRLRIVSRTDTRHSLPLDVTVIKDQAQRGALSQLAPVTLDCVSVTPAEEITEVVSAAGTSRRRFTVENRCDAPVSIDRAELRFGDQGFRLATPPTTVPVNGRAEVEVAIDGHDAPRERADIVLLDLSLARGASGRYALGVWSVSASSIGKR